MASTGEQQSPDGEPHDPLYHFFMHCDSVARDAQFLVDSLPNASLDAVERAVYQLDSIRGILISIDDLTLSDNERQDLVSLVESLLHPLMDFLQNPPVNPTVGIPKVYTGKRGRPRYALNLERAVLLHELGNSYEDIADAFGIGRTTLYEHLERAGLRRRKPFTEISDDDLDAIVSDFASKHPFSGSTILAGHLEAQGIHLPRLRVQESLRRVDAIGVLIRFAGLVKRRVYKVRGANALWHQDGNEKLKPWGFYVHGCIDGHSRRIIYLACTSNKRQSTVGSLWRRAVATYGWPSRARGDFGTENNEIERMMNRHWGVNHRAYLRGRSLHNVRIERLWRDVRKDVLESFRQIFLHLEEIGLLDMENRDHRTCLYLTYQPRIQQALNREIAAWNNHKIRTARNRTPIAMYELSRERAINRGYWTGDPGDDTSNVDGSYGSHDYGAPTPPAEEISVDPVHPREEPEGREAQHDAGIVVNDDEELEEARELLAGFNFERDDGEWGIKVFVDALAAIKVARQAQPVS